MKLGTVIPYRKKIQKIYESCDTRPDLCWNQHFFTRNLQILLYQKIRYRLHFSTWFLILLAFFESLKIYVVNLLIILMMSAKMATAGLFKKTVFWNKGYDVIFSVNGFTSKSLSRDSNYIVDVLIWPKFGNCSISMRELITISIL